MSGVSFTSAIGKVDHRVEELAINVDQMRQDIAQRLDEQTRQIGQTNQHLEVISKTMQAQEAAIADIANMMRDQGGAADVFREETTKMIIMALERIPVAQKNTPDE